MIAQVIDLVIDNRIPSNNEDVRIARGKYELPLSLKDLVIKTIRKIKKIE